MAASKNPGAANAVIVGGQAVAAQTQLNFSRDMEREADRVGFGVLTEAGFAPQGFVTMFAKLQQSSRLNDAGGFPYLRSHPLTTERMSDMQNRIPSTSVSATPAMAQNDPAAGDTEQAMVAARARVASNTSADALRNWALQAQDSRFQTLPVSLQAGILYGATYAALQMRDFSAAQKWWAPLSLLASDAPALRLVQLLGAEMALAQGDAAGARHLLATLAAPQRRAEVLLAAQAAVRSGHADVAAQSLQAWLADHPRDATAWQGLATAHTALGRTVAAIRAEAEVNIAQLNYADALIRLQAAQDASRSGKIGADYFEASIVDTRIKQVQQVLKEQALER
jgi:predicted Zn-dependent protease